MKPLYEIKELNKIIENLPIDIQKEILYFIITDPLKLIFHKYKINKYNIIYNDYEIAENIKNKYNFFLTRKKINGKYNYYITKETKIVKCEDCNRIRCKEIFFCNGENYNQLYHSTINIGSHIESALIDFYLKVTF